MRQPPQGAISPPKIGAIAGTRPMIEAMRDNSRPAWAPS